MKQDQNKMRMGIWFSGGTTLAFLAEDLGFDTDRI
jgi:hypothetical protein